MNIQSNLNQTEKHNNEFKITGNYYEQVVLENTTNCHVGDVINIFGPLTINYNVNHTEQVTDIQQTIFVNIPEPPKDFPLIERNLWLAKPSTEENSYLNTPNIVIILHTVTESSTKFVENRRIIQLVQSYHMESKKWSDIAYNFMIGCDGRIYEGRGWNTIGAHTFKFNSISIGVAFIGTFEEELPTKSAIESLNKLIEFGVKNGFLAPDYKLLGHCQCSQYTSPGAALYELIKAWSHWSHEI